MPVSREGLLAKLRAFAVTPDDDVIRFKEKIKGALLCCPELLFALNCAGLEGELFDAGGAVNAGYEDGVLVPFGEWDRYFGTVILDYMFIPDVQAGENNFLCYTVGWHEAPRYNSIEYRAQIVFTVLCSCAQGHLHDSATGLARHDLIGAIIRERFNWSNIFGTQCRLVSNVERVTDFHYLTRQLVFECTLLNGIVGTAPCGRTSVINNRVRV